MGSTYMAVFLAGDRSGASHPLSYLESLAIAKEWSFNRIDEDMIILRVESSWRILSIIVSLSHVEETIKLTCSFDLNPRNGMELGLLQLINQINRKSTGGAFTIDQKKGRVVYLDRIMLNGTNEKNWKRLNVILTTAVHNCEKYYPSFQLVNFGKSHPQEALDIVMADVMGTA